MAIEGEKVDLEPLLALARGQHHKSKYRRMRDLLPGILVARNAGMQHDAILGVLKAEYGLDLEPGTYHLYLHRLKSEAKTRGDLPSIELQVSAQALPPGSQAQAAHPPIQTETPIASRKPATPPIEKPPGVSPAAWAATLAAQRQRKR